MYAVFRLAHEIFLNFSTELWPLTDVKISIFRNNEWILIKFCLCIDIYDPSGSYIDIFYAKNMCNNKKKRRGIMSCLQRFYWFSHKAAQMCM